MSTSVRHSESMAQLAAALVKAQAELKNPPKDSVNPHFRSKYADLATVRDAVVPVLARHKLAVVQMPCEFDGEAALATMLLHESGEWLETTIKLRPIKADPQGVGSALTYARRYALQSVAGVAADADDDGHTASRPAPQQQRPAPQPRPATPREFSPSVSMWAQEVVGKLRAALSRDVAVDLWREVDAREKAGQLSQPDKAAIDAEFREFGVRFPKPAKV